MKDIPNSSIQEAIDNVTRGVGLDTLLVSGGGGGGGARHSAGEYSWWWWW